MTKEEQKEYDRAKKKLDNLVAKYTDGNDRDWETR